VRLTGRAEHAHARLTLDVILPFVGVGVPMHLAHSAGIDLDERRGDRGGNRKRAGIANPHRSALGLDRLLRQQPVTEALRRGSCARDLVGAKRSRHWGREDIELAGVGRVAERRGRRAEILGQHVVRRMLEPVADQERVVLIEVAVIEHQKEFGAIGIKALDRVRNARREIPEIADPHVIDEVSPFGVDGGDAGLAVKHVGPLGGLVPMHLTHTAGIEPHVHTGDILGNAELARGHLTGPAARLQPHVRVGEREAQIRQRAVIGRGRDEQVGVLPVPHDVARAVIGAAVAGALGLRDGFAALRGCRCGRREEAPGRSRCQHVTTRDGIHAALSLMLSAWDVSAWRSGRHRSAMTRTELRSLRCAARAATHQT
jgi:hypothetical protein